MSGPAFQGESTESLVAAVQAINAYQARYNTVHPNLTAERDRIADEIKRRNSNVS